MDPNAAPEERRDGAAARNDRVPAAGNDSELDLSGLSLPPRPAGKESRNPEPAPERRPEPTAAPAEKSAATRSSDKPAEPGWTPDDHHNPRPWPGLMRALGPLNDWFMLRGVPILRNLPGLNRLPFARGLLQFTEVDLPKEDIERLRRTVNKDTAAFIGANHPEFLTDAMIDKEISRSVSPLMAIWADKGIVNMHPLAQKFFLANNLVSNVRKGGGKEYSIRYALTGNGVLLHPEGMVAWTGNKVHSFFPGIVDMAIETALRARASGDGRPVYIAPLVYKYTFVEDASRGLHAEIKTIEKRTGLPVRSDLSLEDRFFELHRGLLAKHEERFGTGAAVRAEPITARNHFARQSQLVAKLIGDVEARYGTQPVTGHRKLFTLENAVRKSPDATTEQKREDLERLKEARRLLELSPDLYARESLCQEDIAECLKRAKRDLLGTTLLDRVRNFFPRPVGWRAAHVRAAEPIDVTRAIDQAGGDSPALRASLLSELRRATQSRLDGLVAELSPELERFARPNPFHSGPNGLTKH